MPLNRIVLNTLNKMPDWITIQEAVKISSSIMNKSLTASDIYRNALSGNIYLSIYFPSPVILRKISTMNNKVKLRPAGHSFLKQFCMLEANSFINGVNLITSTYGKFITPAQRIIDTSLIGHEYVIVQILLAQALNIPLPLTGASNINYGISVLMSGEIYQLFEKSTWKTRIERQTNRLPKCIASNIYENSLPRDMDKYEHFPIYNLPQDASFVIRHSELEKLINIPANTQDTTLATPRISTPLSRLFWLACKHNKEISPLISQPYKLLSIFEQWAITDGMTDRLSGDTLKTALKRGSPTSV